MGDSYYKSTHWCGWCSGDGCEQCDPNSEEYYDSLYDDCEDDNWTWDDQRFDCGMVGDGICLLAGSEECDWECPHRFALFQGSRTRNLGDKIHRRMGNLWHLVKNLHKLRRKRCDCGNTEWTVYGPNWLCNDCVPF